MKTVMRANKQLRISDDQLEVMEKVGYVEVDERTGKPVKPNEAIDLKGENAVLKEENKRLTQRVEELMAQVESATKKTRHPPDKGSD